METTFVVHDWRAAQRLPEIEAVVNEVAQLCVASLGQVPHVSLTVTYLNRDTLDAFWRASEDDSGSVARLAGESLLSVSVADMVHLATEDRLVVRADSLLRACRRCLQ